MTDRIKRSIVLLLAVAMVMLAGCSNIGNILDKQNAEETPVTQNEANQVENTENPKDESEEPVATPTPEITAEPQATDVAPDNTGDSSFEVQFIDCGQGDSILLRSNNETMLIDAANNKDGASIVAYLQSQGITRLDYVVGTHPDADHIGGLDTVIDTFDIGKVYMPKKQNNTKTFEDVLTAISNKGLKISSPKPGTEITFGSAKLTILGPIEYYDDDNNNNSIVIRAVHGKNSFLFTGDAELQEETDLMDSGAELQATVLKVGHHGSNTATSRFFLEKVKPTYAVISCGTGNKYGHPHKEVIDYLDMGGITTYRTDLQQTIIMISNGEKLDITTGNPSAVTDSSSSTVSDSKDSNVSNGSSNTGDATKEGSYIGNKNSKKLHRPDCSSLPKEQNRVYFSTREEAVGEGYDPCARCNP